MGHADHNSNSGMIYGGVAGKLSCVPSRPTQSLLDLLDDHGGWRRDVLFRSIDLKFSPSSYSGALQRRSRVPPRSSAEFVFFIECRI